MTSLTLEEANRLARASLARARELSLNPMSIAVIDASGYLKVALRDDGSGLAGIDIALGKARAALTFGCSSREIADALSPNRLASDSVLANLQGRVVLLPGGVVIRAADGSAVGALGAAGDSPDNDEAIVLAATRT
jgi:uncharacterized protein GlcG (DUF336 family)